MIQVFIAIGDNGYDFEEHFPSTLSSNDFDSTVEQFRLENDLNHYALTPELTYSFEGDQYEKTHSILVVAECSGFYSDNRNPANVILSSKSPVLYDGVNVKGMYLPTDSLVIELDNDTLGFNGLLLDNHREIEVDDYLSGMTTSQDFFFVKVLGIIFMSESFVQLEISIADPIEEVYKEIEISFQSSVFPEDDDELVSSQRRLLRSNLMQQSNHDFIGDERIGVMDAASYLSSISNKHSRDLREVYNKFFDFSKDYYYNMIEARGTFLFKITFDISKKVIGGKIQEVKKIGYERTLTSTITFGMKTALDPIIFNDPSDDDHKPIWAGPTVPIPIPGTFLKLQVQPILDGWIKFSSKIVLAAVTLEYKSFDSGSVTLTSGSEDVGRQGDNSPSKDPPKPIIKFGQAVEGLVDVTATLAFGLDIHLIHEKFYTVSPLLTFNLKFKAMIALYHDPNTAQYQMAWKMFDLYLYLEGQVSGQSKGLGIGKFGPILFGEFFPTYIISLPQAQWIGDTKQVCFEDRNGRKVAAIEYITLQVNCSKDTLTWNCPHSDIVPWYASTPGWQSNLYHFRDDFSPDTFSLALRKEIPQDSITVPLFQTTIHAFVYPGIPGKILPAVYSREISVASANCPTKAPTKAPTAMVSLELVDLESKIKNSC